MDDSDLFICRWIQSQIISGGYEMMEKWMELFEKLTEQQREYICALTYELFIKDRS